MCRASTVKTTPPLTINNNNKKNKTPENLKQEIKIENLRTSIAKSKTKIFFELEIIKKTPDQKIKFPIKRKKRMLLIKK